ncbi:acyl-CoA N-acyltransferase [Marasmius fiardii PR-910]|nr:acyl-CoA N-acyltransferase [Marasmius fiardii PR-910]
MSVLRPFRADDMFKFNVTNLVVWTDTYNIGFYLNYLLRWPDLCCVQEAPNGRMMGYVIGKVEGLETEWHGHVSVVTVAPEYRMLGLARKMMSLLENRSDETYHGLFVDLYVRCVNTIAIDMYERLGYSVYRRVKEYFRGREIPGEGGRDEEDAFDMRKPLPRGRESHSIRANGRDVLVSVGEAR